MPRTLDEVLQSTSDVLFPADLGERPVAIDSHGSDGDTPLHVMAWRNDLEAVEILIAAGADVNAVGDMGETPLHVAVRRGNVAMAEALLKAGARDDIRSEFESTPREKAVEMGGAMAELFRRENDT
jgi:ankyrin repeat protein